MISLPRRNGDNAQMVRMEWTEKVELEDKKKEDKKDESKKSEPKKIESKKAKIVKKSKKDSSLNSSNPKS
jgi:hypothetical protein